MNRADPFFERDATGCQFMDMETGRSVLEYNLYTAAARTTVWGETVGTDTVGGTGQGMSSAKANTHTVYGTIANSAANQDAPTGLYTDSVAVTV